MISIQRIGQQGVQELKLEPGARVQLQTGQSLVVSQEGVQAQRRGNDLVLVVEGSNGEPQQVIVANFFRPGLTAQVLLQEPGEPVKVITPQAQPQDLAQTNPASRSDEPKAAQSRDGMVPKSYFEGDLRVDDAVLRAQAAAAGALESDTAPEAAASAAPEPAQATESLVKRALDVIAVTVEALPPAPDVPTLNVPQPGGSDQFGYQEAKDGLFFSGTTSVRAQVELIIADRQGNSRSVLSTAGDNGQWQITVPLEVWRSLGSGEVSVSVRAFNSTGQASASSAPKVLSIDVEPPAAPTLVLPELSGTLASLPLLNRAALGGTFSGVAEANSQVELQFTDALGVTTSLWVTADNGGLWRFALPENAWQALGLSEGAVSVKARATDLAGNTGSWSTQRDFYVDVTAPTGNTVQVPENAQQVGAVYALNRQAALDNPAFTGKTEAGAKVVLVVTDSTGTTVRVEGQADANGNWSLRLGSQALLGFAEGPLTVSVQTTDAAGNVAPPVTLGPVLEVHTIPPQPLLGASLVDDSGRAGDGITRFTRPTLQFAVGTNASKVVLWQDTDADGVIDDSEAASVQRVDVVGSSIQTTPLSALADGAHTFSAVVEDAWGNRSTPVSVSFRVDSAAQGLKLDTVASDNSINDAEFSAGVNLSGTAEAGAAVTIEVRQNGVLLHTYSLTASRSGGWNLSNFGRNLDTPLQDGTVQLTVVQTDVAGNTQTESRTIATRINPLQTVSSVRLDAGSNTNSTTDTITSDTTPLITGTGPVGLGLQVAIYRDGVLIDTVALVNGTFNWQVGSPGALQALGEGLHNLTFRVREPSTGSESSQEARLSLTIDTQVAAPTIGDVGGSDNFVNAAEYAAGVDISGTAEAGASVTLTLRSGSGTVFTITPIIANAAGVWTYRVSSAVANALGDGVVTATVSQVDAAGNDSAAQANGVGTSTRVFEINKSTLRAPTLLDLTAADDTGRSDIDNVTNKTQVTMGTTVNEAGLTVSLFDDVDSDGTYTAGTDVLLATKTVASAGAVDFTVELSEGVHFLRTWAQDQNGRRSSASSALNLTVDTQVSDVTDLRVSADNFINSLEKNSGTTIAGSGEAQATLTLKFFAAGETQPRLTITGVTVGGDGSWVLPLSSSQIAELGEDGTYTLEVQQTDRAGNISGVRTLTFVLDTQPPRAPTGTELDAAAGANATGPWSDDNGVTWGDLYTYYPASASYRANDVKINVALPTLAAQGTNTVAVDDKLTLNWGSLSVSYTLTQADIDRGYAIVTLKGSQIEAAGVYTALDVTASFTDAAGNKGDDFTVLSGIDVGLTARPPTLVLEDAYRNASNASDTTWYSNHSFYGTSANKSFSMSGEAEARSSVEVGYFDQSGTWRSLALALADDSGSWRVVLPMPAAMQDGLYKLQARTLAGGQLVYSAALDLQLDTAVPSAPTVTQTSGQLGGDGLINASERNSVPLSGTAEPGALVSIQLINTLTGVAGTVIQVRADSQGQWSRSLGVVDWGQVGEGSIEMRVWQTDLAGNVSRQTGSNGQITGQGVRSVVYDASVNAPTLETVAGNGYVNAAEATGNVTLRGSGEPGATLTIQLVGRQTTLSYSVEVGADGTWRFDLSPANLSSLGGGTVGINLSQTDRAGNASSVTRGSFVIDTQVTAPTLDTGVAGDDIINASEKALGVSLAGGGEAGATVQITLTDSKNVAKTFTAVVGSNGRYSRVLTPAELTGLADGNLNVSVTQTDLAGNVSGGSSSSIRLSATPLSSAVVISPVSGDDRISYTEQLSSLTLQGTAPAGTQVRLQLVGVKSTLPSSVLSPTTTAGGSWSVVLTPAQMEALGAGTLSLQAWAQDASGNTTAVITRNLVLEGFVPTPTLNGVATDNIINAAEASAAGGVALSGTGVVGYLVNLELTGSSGRKITLSSVVGSDGNWSMRSLTSADMDLLGQGAVSVRAWQKTDANASDGDANKASVVMQTGLLIDTMAPATPAPGSVARNQADGYNSATSAAKDGQISLAEAQEGVTLAIPVRDAGGELTLAVGDRITLLWGSASQEVTLTAADIEAIGSRFVYYLNVQPSTIAAAGSGQQTVSVIYTDAAGNASPPVTLINTLTVVAPPPVPLLSTVGGDGFINLADYTALGGDGTIAVTGSTASNAGTVVLEIVNTTTGKTLAPVTLQISSSNAWSYQLRAAQLDTLGEGTIDVRATFVRSADNATSPVATGSFVYDKTLPDAPTAENQSKADEANAVSELAGGLIRVGGNVTEASQTVQVRVALPANAAPGDKVTLNWGSASTQVSTLVGNTDLQAGFVVVSVPVSVITAVGDSDALTVSAFFTDAAGNQGPTRTVWTGKVDALPPLASLAPPSFGEWLNAAEAAAAGGWQLGGSCESGASVTLTLTGANGQVVTRNLSAIGGSWSAVLSASDAAKLGDGLVSVNVVQYDANGNPSSPSGGSFRIDLTPPPAPVVDAPTANLTFAQTQAGQNFTGTAEANAAVTVRFVRGVNSITRNVYADANGVWSARLEAADFVLLSNGYTGGAAVFITATQTDVADNVSSVSTARNFSYSAVAMTAPSVQTFSGLSFDGSDSVVSGADVDYSVKDAQGNPTKPMTITGTGPAGLNVRVVLTVAGKPTSFDLPVDANGAWTLRLTESQFNALGQGAASLTASTIQLDAQGAVINESLPGAMLLGGGSTFTIDTVVPQLLTATIKGTGLNGNAKAGDWIEVVLSASESLVVTGTPTVTLTGFGASGTGTVLASYDAAASALLGPSRMVLRYQVKPGDVAGAGAISMVGTLTMAGGVSVRDAAGNNAVLTLPAKATDTVTVDTTAPGAPALSSLAATTAGSAGGIWINQEEADATVAVTLNLSGTGVVAGDTIELLWIGVPNVANRALDVLPAGPYTYSVSASQAAAGSVTLQLPASVIGQMSGTAAVKVRLVDKAGNASGYSTEQLVNVDTIAPAELTANTWMGDDRIGIADASQIAALTGRGAEAGASIQARLVKGTQVYELAASDITVNADGTWSLSASALSTLVNAIADGDFSVSVRQVDARGNAGQWSNLDYYKDTSLPNPPSTPQIALASDGWINAADAGNLLITVSISGSGAQVGDTVRVRGLGTTLSQVISAADITNGFVSFSPAASAILQSAGAAARSNIEITAEIDDRGGNVSATSTPLVTGLDTNVSKPTVTRNALTDGIVGTEANANHVFTGTGIEAGANVSIILTGASGKLIRLVPAIGADGSFSATLTPGDLTTLGEGFTSYSVEQTDRAGNKSEANTGGFNITLSTPAPVINDFAGDNVVGVRAGDGQQEWLSTQVLSGSTLAGATVLVDFYIQGGTSPVIANRSATVDANGKWTLNVTPEDFAAMQNAAGGSTSFQGYFRVTATINDSLSLPATQTFQFNTSAPTLLSQVTLFDANGDGAKNDGLEISFSEPVRVQDLSTLSTAFVTSKLWGTGARIEAVNTSTANGVLYATSFKIYLGPDNTFASGDVVSVLQSKIVNAGGNVAHSIQSFTLPQLEVPASPVPQLNVSTDNAVNQSEKASLTDISFTHRAIATGETLKLFVDGVFIRTITPTTGSVTTNVSLSASDLGASDGVHSVMVQHVDAAGNSSQFSSPKMLTVDTSLQSGGRVVWDDTNGDGLMNTGDRLQVTFNEGVSITTGTLDSSFGSNASVSALDGVVKLINGVSTTIGRTWNIVLGENSTVAAGDSVVFGSGLTQVADSSGNRGSIQVNVPSAVADQPLSVIIDNVTSDNIVGASERSGSGAVRSVNVLLNGAKSGDVVTLYMDGLVVGTTTLEGASSSASVNLNSGFTWGADGERVLTAKIERPASGGSAVSDQRWVHVAADQAHWSQQGGMIWFDTDTIAQATGTAVYSWSASVGGSVATSFVTANTDHMPKVVRNAVNGRTQIYFNGGVANPNDSNNGSWMTFNDPLGLFSSRLTTRTTAGGVEYRADDVPYTVIANGVYAQDGNWRYVTEIGAFGSLDGIASGGVGVGVEKTGSSLFALQHSRIHENRNFLAQASPYLTPPNSVNVGSQFLVSHVYKPGLTQLYSNNFLVGQSNGNYAMVMGGPYAGGQYVIGGTQLASNNQPNAVGELWRGLVGDIVWANWAITGAALGEINTYQALKAATTGLWRNPVTARETDGSYDLSSSVNNGNLLDDVLMLNLDGTYGAQGNSVTVAGADAVNAGAGADVVKTKDLTFRTLDGGLGRDTLALHQNYNGPSNIVLADFVSNARGMGSDTAANTRVNAAGYHKLQGFEVIDTRSSDARQLLTVGADDVNQLSETNTLEVRLGLNDVLFTQGLGTGQRGIYKFNDNWYDTRYSVVSADGQTISLYSAGGDQLTTLSTVKWASPQLMQINLDHAMSLGTPLAGHFSLSALGGTGDSYTGYALSTVNQRQGLQFSFESALTGPLKITYTNQDSVTLLRDESGRSFASHIWLVGTDGADTDTTAANGTVTYRLNASVLTEAEQAAGVTIIGGGGADRMTGGSGADTLIGGMSNDNITGGAGSDTFRYVNEVAGSGADGNLGGTLGDIITDFNFGRDVNGTADATQADRLDLRHLFSTNFTGRADVDAATLSSNGMLDIRSVLRRVNGVDVTDWQVWVDRDGKDAGGANALGLLATLQNVQLGGSATGITGAETTSELLQKMLEEGRLVVA